jgi:hypothetical protein
VHYFIPGGSALKNVKNVNHSAVEVINCNYRINGQFFKTSVLAGCPFFSPLCEMFAYPSTVTQLLKLSHFS